MLAKEKNAGALWLLPAPYNINSYIYPCINVGIPKTIEIHFLNKLSSRALAANFLFSMLYFTRYTFECYCA